MPKRITKEDFINRSNKIHNFKYDYSKFEYINYDTAGIIICKKHGKFEQDYWHGHPTRYSPNNLNTAVKKTYGELYDRTIAREILIKQAGYNLITIWESDWNKMI